MANEASTRQARGGSWRAIGWGGAVALVLLPVAAARLTSEISWSPFEFFLFAGLVGAVGIAFELLAGKTGSTAYRIAAGIALLLAFLLIWSNLAVGLIGNEDNPLNWMFGGVIGVALLGAVLCGFKAIGMAHAMAGAAIVQVVAGAVALNAGYFIPGVTVVCAGLWLLSAWLFRQAARDAAHAPA